MYQQYEEEIEQLEHRDFIADIRSYGKNYDFISKTPDMPKKYNLGHIIERNNIGKYSVKEIINNIKGESKIDINMFQ